MFKEVPTNKLSLSCRKLIHGKGINNATYKTSYTINNRRIKCPYYEKWTEMLKRCYSDKFHSIRPTYIGCSVSKEWLTFSNFKKWMEKQDWKNKDLDKDILFINNKVYSKNTCVFIKRELNNLLNTHEKDKGKYPTGVSKNTLGNKFAAKIRIKGKLKHLGSFNTIEEAFITYKKAKKVYILTTALIYKTSNYRLYNSLILQANNL